MISFKKTTLLALLLSTVGLPLQAKFSYISPETDFEVYFWGLFKPEAFYGNRFIYLNKNVPQDKTFYFRHTNDFFLDFLYGKETYGYPVAEFKASVRNRAVWGSSSSIALTLPAESPFLNAEIRDHHHAFPRLFWWIREAWLQLSLSDFLHLGLENDHRLTLGAFPFELGRGIALGSAYAVGPGPLGFYSDAMIDQYAFGLKLSGDLVCDILSYDIYGAILQSRSSTFNDTNKPVFKNEIGRREDPARGFGHDNYLVAARLIWDVFDNDRWGNLSFEPYVLYNNDPEQKVEFPADASSKLGTFGFAGEYINGKFECGFDFAQNMGRQFVRAWDRNHIILENINGVPNLVNSQVLISSTNAFNGKKVPEVPNSDAQRLINQSADTGTSAQNSLIIPGSDNLPSVGTITGPLSLQNSDRRFRTINGGGYSNIYHGFMIVADASYWLYKKDFQIAATAGIASGDKDPNNNVVDGTYDGFIGLQEVYSGKRVKSVFLLGTVGKVKRPGTTPEDPLANKDFAASHTGFTNLTFLGAGCTWKPSWCDTRFVWNPNVLAYWADVPPNKFDAITRKDLPFPASSFMGVELNSFLSYYPFSTLKCFAITSVFFPGQYFTDIKGKPLSSDQKRALQKTTNPSHIPNIGDNVAYTLNIGLEFAF